MPEQHSGVVKWFNNSKGFGFIGREKAKDVFVHYSQIQSDGYRTLNEGDQVTFSIGIHQGKEQAENVVVVKSVANAGA